jgi:hypothetical protein
MTMIFKAAFENWTFIHNWNLLPKKLGKVIIGKIEMDKYGFKISIFLITGYWKKK